MADPYVHEVTMVAPDIIRVQVNDPPLQFGAFVDTGSAQVGNYAQWYDFPDPTNGDVVDKAWLMGRGKRWIKFQDKLTGAYFEREAAKVAADYLVDGVQPVSVHYDCHILERGFWLYGGSSTGVYPSIIFKHYLNLVLPAPLVSGAGPYLIEFPAGTGLPDYSFDFNDRRTRSCSIKAPFSGHRPNDELKLAYLNAKVLGLDTPTGEGIIDFINDYSITSFELVNRHGATVWSIGSVALRQAWDAGETSISGNIPDNPNEGSGLCTFASSVEDPIEILSITTSATPTMTVASGHGLAENDVLILGVTGWSPATPTNWVPGAIIRVTNLSGDTFEPYRWGGTAPGSWNTFSTAGATFSLGSREGPANNRVFKAYAANTAATNVYGLDYSAFAPVNLPGQYAIRIPGLGISDYFEIDEHVWIKLAKKFMKYEYNQRLGCALDGRHGYTRPNTMRNGVDGAVFYKSRLPHAWSGQGGVTSPTIPVANVANSSWMTAEEVDAGGGHMDAGDWDIFASFHLIQAARYLMMRDICPAAFDSTDFNVPLTSELEGAAYSNLDDAPSIVHAAVWSFLWLKRCQEVDGRVPGGTCGRSEASGGPSQSFREPSWLNMLEWYTFLPEPRVNFTYAGCAAMLARILNDLGLTAAATEWLASAELAFAWAEDVVRKTMFGTSTTSRTIGTGSLTFTLATAFPANVGDTVRSESVADPANYIEGPVTARSQGSITINATSTGGSGTIANWKLYLAEYDKNYYFADATGVKDSLTFTGDTTLNSHVLSNLSSVAGLSVGMQVTGTNIPTSGSSVLIIKSIDSASQITLRPITDQYDVDGNLVYQNPSRQLCTGNGSGITFTAAHPGGPWSQSTFDTAVTTTVNASRSARVFALATIARAKGAGGSSYRTKFNYHYADSNFLGLDGIGRLDYARDPLADPTVYASIVTSGSTGVGRAADDIVALVEGSRAYRLIFDTAPTGTLTEQGEVQAHSLCNGQNATFVSDAAKREKYRKTLMSSVGHTLGANDQGVSYLKDSALPRHLSGMLHVDSFSYGTPRMGADGITLYGPSLQTQFGSNTSAFNLFGNSALSDVNHIYTPGNTTNDEYRVIEPFPAMRSLYDIPDSRWSINEGEFGTTGSAMGFVYSMTLHGYDGNTQEDASSARISINLQAVA